MKSAWLSPAERDPTVAEVVRYAIPAAALFESAKRMRAWIDACHARPGFKPMASAPESEPA